MSDAPKPTPFNLNMHTARLLMREPFFAALSRKIDKTPTTSLPTAGVRINPERAQFELLYNPEFMGALKDEHKLGVLEADVAPPGRRLASDDAHNRAHDARAALVRHPSWQCRPRGRTGEGGRGGWGEAAGAEASGPGSRLPGL